MSDPTTGEPSWQHTVVAGLLALVGAAVLVGLFLGLAAVAGARVTGLHGGSGKSGGEAGLYMPAYTQTPMEEDTPSPSKSPSRTPSKTPSKSASPNGSSSGSPSGSPSASQTPASDIVLSASPATVSANQTVSLSGSYPGGSGTLQVQRMENGAWVDFPVDTLVGADGSFNTTISSGRKGTWQFRMFDAASGRSSNAVQVVIQ